MSNLKKLIESIDRIANPAQKDGDQWKGTDSGTPGTKLVGEKSERFLGEPYIREDEGGDGVDEILEYLTSAHRKITMSDAYSTDAKNTMNTLYRMLRVDLKGGSIDDFNQDYSYLLGKYPDEMGELVSEMFVAAGFGPDGTIDQFMAKVGAPVAATPTEESLDDITEAIKKAFEDYVSNDKYDADKLYPGKSKKPTADKKKEKPAKIIDPKVLGEDINETVQNGDIVQLNSNFKRAGLEYFRVDTEEAIGATQERPWIGDLETNRGYYVDATDLEVVVSASEANTAEFTTVDEVENWLDGYDINESLTEGVDPSVVTCALQLQELMFPQTRDKAFAYIDSLRAKHGQDFTLKAYKMAQEIRKAGKQAFPNKVDEDFPATAATDANGKPVVTQQQGQPAVPTVPTAQPIVAPKTTAQQPAVPAGTTTAIPAAGQPTLPTAGQAGGAPVAPATGTPAAPTGTAANVTTTPVQTLATSIQQLAQPGNQIAAKKAADALSRVR